MRKASSSSTRSRQRQTRDSIEQREDILHEYYELTTIFSKKFCARKIERRPLSPHAAEMKCHRLGATRECLPGTALAGIMEKTRERASLLPFLEWPMKRGPAASRKARQRSLPLAALGAEEVCERTCLVYDFKLVSEKAKNERNLELEKIPTE